MFTRKIYLYNIYTSITTYITLSTNPRVTILKTPQPSHRNNIAREAWEERVSPPHCHFLQCFFPLTFKNKLRSSSQEVK